MCCPAARDKSKILLDKSTFLVACPAGQVQKFPQIFIFQVLNRPLVIDYQRDKSGTLLTISEDNYTIIAGLLVLIHTTWQNDPLISDRHMVARSR